MLRLGPWLAVSQRTARLDELLREEISAIVTREVDDPRVGFVTITDVEVSQDLRHANVWVSIIGEPDHRRQAMRALGGAMPFVRRRLGKLRLKYIPELHLREDRTTERGTRILRILDDLESGREPTDAPLTETLPTPGPEPTTVLEDGPEAGAADGDTQPMTRGRAPRGPQRGGQRGTWRGAQRGARTPRR